MATDPHASVEWPGAPRCARCGERMPAGQAWCLVCAGRRALALSGGDGALVEPRPPEVAAEVPRSVGPYQLIEEIGRGGMGRVFLAQHRELGRLVALKLVTLQDRGDERGLRFLREARTLAALHHPGIVAVHDAGMEGGQAYLAMDHIAGGDLAARLRAGPLTVREAAAHARRLAEALAAAHTRGVLHRDIKPSNVLLADDGPRLADFGLAVEQEESGGLTLTGTVLGTPQYLPPEVLARGAGAHGPAGDLYALGVVLYEMLTGRTPFAGAGAVELPGLHARTEPPSVRVLAPAVPIDLATICHRCLEPEPARRYPDAGALAADLRRWEAGEVILARPVPGWRRATRWLQRRPGWLAAGLMGAGLLVTGLGGGLWITFEYLRAEAALQRLEASVQTSRLRLREALVAQARVARHSPEPGARAAALRALAQAHALGPGDDVRDEAVATILRPAVGQTERWEHGGERAVSVLPSPDGRRVLLMPVDLTIGDGAEFWLRDTQDSSWSQPVRPLVEQPDQFPDFSADGSHLLWHLNDGSLQVRRLDTGEERRLGAGGAQGEPLPMATFLRRDHDWHPAGESGVVARREGGWRTVSWDGAVSEPQWPELRVRELRYAPDGAVLAIAGRDAAGREEVALHAANDGEARRLWSWRPTGEVLHLNWSPDGRRLAVVTDDGMVTFCDRWLGRPVVRWSSPVPALSEARHGGPGLLVLRGAGTLLTVVTAHDGRAWIRFEGVGNGWAVLPGGERLRWASLQGDVETRSLRGGAGWVAVPASRVGGYTMFADTGGTDLSDDGRRLLTVHGGVVVVRDPTTGALLAERMEENDAHEFGGGLFTADGGVLRVSRAGGVSRHAWKESADEVGQIGPAETVDAEPGYLLLARSADRRRVALGGWESEQVRILSADETGRWSETARWAEPGVYTAAFSPDGQELLVNASGLGEAPEQMQLVLRRAADGALLRVLPAAVSCDTAWSADGRVAMTSNGEAESIVWEAADWTVRRRLGPESGLGGNTTTFALSADGELAAVAVEDRLTVIGTRDGAVRWRLPSEMASGLATAVRFLPGSGRRLLVLWRDGAGEVFDLDALEAGLAEAGLGS